MTIISYTNAHNDVEEVLVPKDKYIIQMSDLSIKFTDPVNPQGTFTINFNSREEYKKAVDTLKSEVSDSKLSLTTKQTITG